jgi:hypothetical protein
MENVCNPPTDISLEIGPVLPYVAYSPLAYLVKPYYLLLH